MWKTGAILIRRKVYKYQVKQFEEGSVFGIEGGRISKLFITLDGIEVASYDRGWDTEPADEAAALAVAIVLKELN